MDEFQDRVSGSARGASLEGPGFRASLQKSAVSPSAAFSSSILSGQSAPVMSQNLHSAELGTCAAGVSAAMRLISPARRSVNFWSTAAAGTSTV